MKCMQTYFGGHGFYGFEDLGTFCLPSETAKLTIVHGGGGGQKIELVHNFNASRGCCMQTNFGGCGLSCFGDFGNFCLPSKNGQISLSDHGLQSVGVKK